MCDGCDWLGKENSRLTDELSGLLVTVRKLGAENVRLRGQIDMRDGVENTKRTHVWMIVENWLWLCRGRKRNDGKGRLPLIDPGSKRWLTAQAALNREPEGIAACMEAVEGLACRPYVTDQGRASTGRPSERYDDIQYALRDEIHVERCRRYRAEAIGASESVLFAVWQQAAATEQLWLTLWTGKMARDRFDRQPEYKRVAHRMRVAEQQDDEAASLARVIDLKSRRTA